MQQAVLVYAAALLAIVVTTHAPAFAQPEKKVDVGKVKDSGDKAGKDSGKSKAPEKSGEPAKEKAKIPIEQMKLPNNAIIVVVEDLLKAGALMPSQWIVPLEEWLALQDRVKLLENQLKGERVLPSSCRLTGELKDDFVVFRGEYVFATGTGKITVPLGLQGGHLIKEGQLDKAPAILEFDKDDGFVARVNKEGNPHRLTLEFRVPVKKATSGSLDRSIELGLPLTAGTVLDLTLPVGVRELRWNGNAEKPIAPGRWTIGLDRSKALNLAWKAPMPPSGNAPLAKVDSQIKVDVDASYVNISAEIFVEDRRLRTEEWHFDLPSQSKIETVKAPAGLNYTLEEKPNQAVLRVPVSSDRWQVTITQRVPRPNVGTRLPIGPFAVFGAYQAQGAKQTFAAFEHRGAINIKMPAEASLGQRLVFTRPAIVSQTKSSETEAAFQFTIPAPPEKAAKIIPKAPLELEWRFDKNQLRTRVEHNVKVQSSPLGWEIDTATRIHVTALFSTINSLDLKLPASRPHGMLLVGAAAPVLAFPASLPWGGVWSALGTPGIYHGLDDFTISDEAGNEVKISPQDNTGKTRITWARGAAKETTLTLKSTLRVPASTRRLRLELSRPLATQDRGAKISMQSDERTEILHGPEGFEEATPERHHFGLALDQAPTFADIAWRPHERDIVTESVLDIDVHEFSAQITQTLRFPRDRTQQGADEKNIEVKLKAPRGLDKVMLLSDGELSHDRARDILWVRLNKEAGDAVQVTLQYHLPIANKALAVVPIWPAHGSHEDVKVRLWLPVGVQARLSPEILQRGIWKERGIEVVKNRDEFPAMVLAGFGSKLPLIFRLEDAVPSTLAALVAERALIQVRMAEDGSQQVQARYHVTRINASTIDVELPLPWSRFRDPPMFYLGGQQLTQFKKQDTAERWLRLQIPARAIRMPVTLKITYAIPVEALERCNFWSTTLHAPVLRSDAVVWQKRWQLTTPAPAIAASLGRNVRADTEWNLHGWLLTPEPSSADWDAWLNGRQATQPGPPVTFAFAETGAQSAVIYHLPRSWWLLGCSGIFLVILLSAYFSPFPRWAYWLLLGCVTFGLAAFTLLCPAAWQSVVFGLQPGVVLFLVFIAIHRLLQERYRRQLVFLPGFARPKAGSTITRTGSSKRPREASTIDAPTGADDAKSSNTSSGT